ncbi:RidA family protein [Gordonia sp. (in: high G+C Gram-positive bacteria)]|uniref:RidA family protein n=1 Tax=Gordonia sp. (in: high G+C Gram-positive bacteria) TaxID=84139 RepID=UPI0039E5A836
MAVRRDRSESLPDQGFPHSATVAAGVTVFTGGIAPLDADGAVTPPGDVVGQTKQCLSVLEKVLTERGAGLKDIAKLTVHVDGEMKVDLTVAWDAVVEFFGGDVPPTSVVGVTALPLDDQVVEIEAVAAP